MDEKFIKWKTITFTKRITVQLYLHTPTHVAVTLFKEMYAINKSVKSIKCTYPCELLASAPLEKITT